MLELKAMLEALDITLEDLITLCPNVKDSNINYKVKSVEINHAEKETPFVYKENNRMHKSSMHKRIFLQYLDNVKPKKDVEQKLKDLSFSISISYEKNHYKQMLNIVQILCDLGATYVLKATLANIFVVYPTYNEKGELNKCARLASVNEANQNGANIKVITFSEFLEMIGITESELDEMPLPSFDFLLEEDAIVKDKRSLKYLNKKEKQEGSEKEPEYESSGSTLGDIFGDFFDEFKK